MESYFITIDGRPPAKSNMYGVRVVGSGKKARGIIYTKRDLEDYEIAVGKAVEEVVPETLRGYYAIYLRIYQKGKRYIDVDNCFKAILDGIDTTKYIKRGKNNIQVCATGIENDKMFQLLIGERVIFENSNKDEEERVEIIIAPYNGLVAFSKVVQEVYGLTDFEEGALDAKSESEDSSD